MLASAFAWFLLFSNRAIPGVPAATLSNSFFALGFGAIALRAVLPGWLSFVAANGAIFCGYALVLYGLLQFTGGKTDIRVLIVSAALYCAEYAYFYFIDDDFKVRLFCYLVVYATITLWAFVVTIRDYRRSRMRSSLAAAAFLIFLSVSFLASAALSRPDEPVRDIFALTAINASVLFEQIIFVIGWMFSFTLMVNERLLREKIKADKDLYDKNEALQRSNADLEQFAYVSSHDLQTPLRNMIRYAQLLDHRYRGRLDPDADVFIGFIVDSGKHMTALIDDLLEYSRLTNQAKLLQPVPAAQAVAVAQANLKLGLDEAGAELAVGAMPVVMAEPSHLASLFQNLLGNGLKYRAPDRQPRLSVTAERIAPDHWRFAVADNGIGIAPQYHDKIFEIFQRLDPITHTEGTGIGLTLCRRIVHRFGGIIWVDSTPGEGTTFFFTLRDGSAAS